MEWLTPQNVTALILAVLTGVGGSAIVKGILDRKKTAAEARNLDITGDMQLGKGWQEYAEQQRKDKEQMKQELLDQMKQQKEEHDRQIAELNKKFDEVIASKDAMILTLTTSNRQLEARIEDLLRELSRYRGMEQKVDHATEKLHSEVDRAAEDIKHPQTHG